MYDNRCCDNDDREDNDNDKPVWGKAWQNLLRMICDGKDDTKISVQAIKPLRRDQSGEKEKQINKSNCERSLDWISEAIYDCLVM